MRQLTFLIIAAFLVVSAAVPAEAQRRRVTSPTPDTGMWAVDGSVGASAPGNSFLGNGVEVGGALEGYLTPRLAVRGQLRSAWWDFDPALGFTGSLQPVFYGANLVYNVERGVWHPYVTAGVGRYHYRWSEPGVPDGSSDYGGVNMGGGVEFFQSRLTALTAEVLYHKVGDIQIARATLHDGSFWSFAMGAKAYLGR